MGSSLKEQIAIKGQKAELKDQMIHYELILKSFMQKSIILQLMPDAQRLGVFLYSLDSNRIVFGDQNFLDFYNLKAEHLQHPAISRYIYSRFHPEDAEQIKNLELNAKDNHQGSYLNRVVRIRMQNNTYNSYHFLILNLKAFNWAYHHLRIGIQIGLTNIAEECSVKNGLANYKKLIANLSKRESDILRLIVEGYTDNEVGHKLHISPYTAQKHRKNILKKLKLKNTASLSYIAGKSDML